jgi:hypothetical protein
MSRLMIAAQHVWGNHDMGTLDKEMVMVILDLQKTVIASYAKLL